MYNIVIYPYDETIKNTLSHINDDIFKIVGIVSPKGWGYYGRLLEIREEKIIVKANFSEIGEEFDGICFANSRFQLNFENYFLPILMECRKRNKEVFWCREYDEKELNIVKSYISDEKLHSIISDKPMLDAGQMVYDIGTPVVFIVDIFAGLNVYDFQFYIYEELKKRGYATKLISSRKEMGLVESIDTIPEFLFSNYCSIKEKIIKINQYIKMLEVIENPDLIVMGIPGNLFEVSKKLMGDFGSSAYLITRSICPDYVICNIPYFADFENKYEYLGGFVEKRLETRVDAYNVVAKYMDVLASEGRREFDYLSLPMEFVEERIKMNEKVYCLQKRSEISRIVNDIIFKLESYAEIELM